MGASEDPVEGAELPAAARGATLRNTAEPAAEQCEHGPGSAALSNDAEEKLFRPGDDA